jgi:hypothetical protein
LRPPNVTVFPAAEHNEDENPHARPDPVPTGSGQAGVNAKRK